MKKFLCSIIIAVMIISSISVSAEGFADVMPDNWYYDTVTEMTNMGLFKGKGNDSFCPDDAMTKAEFLTVVMRILYPQESFTANPGQKWWQPVYDKATSEIITPADFPHHTMENAISRQEMALLASKALMKRGEVVYVVHDVQGKITDHNTINMEYKMYVEIAYSMGVLQGIDDKGTFAPHNNLSRAQAATVLYRIINTDARTSVN